MHMRNTALSPAGTAPPRAVSACERPHLGIRGLALLLLLLPAGCALPSLDSRPIATAIQHTSDTALARAIAPSIAGHPGLTGVHSLPVATDAFAARAGLAASAERCIDAQYYMWHGDVTGMLLFEDLWQAAERGVRVRLLLDDNNTAGLDHTIAALAAHPNIQVRLFNPLTNRHVRWSNYVFDFSRINHRMHNKSFTVDNEITVVGGRNIGDEYFDAGGDVQFVDLDILAVGPAVHEVSAMFDAFWNSASAYPAPMLVGTIAPATAVKQLQSAFAAARADARAAPYLKMQQAGPLIDALRAHRVEFQWAEVQLVADDPVKVFSHERKFLLLPQLLQQTGAPRSRFDLVSPYFVLMDQGTRDFQSLAQAGIQVRVLTNSLASNDVIAVHAGYAKHRKALLQSGIKLYELKRLDTPARSRGRGSSTGSLHAKTLQIDDSYIFVGSFNFDPRSIALNTEMGVVIKSATMARELSAYFDSRMPRGAFEVKLGQNGAIEWVDTTANGPKVLTSEPGASLFRRAMAGFLSILPIDWLL
jgi:putative cardiolipin synthase